MALRVFITGASSGIGAALVRLYAERSAIVGLVARRGHLLHKLAASLPSTTEIFPCDVRDAPGLRAAAADFIRRQGCPDIVIGNAGISYGTLTECPDDYEAFRDVMDINVAGLVATFQPFIEPMRAAGHGTLVGIASVAGYRGLPGAEAYCASKAAAIAYLESLRVRLRRDGIRVITVCPGYVTTAMTEGNPYPMPFIVSAEYAAGKIVRAIDRDRSYTVLPWQMAIVARLLRALPNWLFDQVLNNAPTKPRRRNAPQ